MENFMKKVTNELQLMENKLSKYETLYLEKYQMILVPVVLLLLILFQVITKKKICRI